MAIQISARPISKVVELYVGLAGEPAKLCLEPVNTYRMGVRDEH